MEVDLAQASDRERYQLLAGLVVPRPVAWVTTVHDRVVNLAPFSFFQVMSPGQRLVGLGIQVHEDGQEKDTLRALRATGELVVNLASTGQVEDVDRSGEQLPSHVSEAEALGLALCGSKVVGVPRLRDVAAALECRVRQVQELGGGDVWVVAEVVHVSVDDAVLHDGLHVRYERFRPLGRLVGRWYVDTRHLLRAGRAADSEGVPTC